MIHRSPDTPGKAETVGKLDEIPGPGKVGKVEREKVGIGKVGRGKVEVPGGVENEGYDMQRIEHIE